MLLLLLDLYIGFFVIGFNFQYNVQPLQILRNYSASSLVNNNSAPFSSSAVNYSEYIVHTRTCSIPSFNPRDPEVLHAIKDNLRPINCGHPALTSMVDRRLIINVEHLKEFGGKTLNDVKCCLQTVSRGHDDYSVIIWPFCTNVETGTKVTAEFVRVSCKFKTRKKKVVEYHFTIPPPHPNTDTRKFTPWNVMVIGLDSVSRLNFERHLPKTRKYLLESMGAVEMFGYTKVGDNTFPNLVAVLGGMSQKEIRTGCWKERGPFDSCTSWIWKQFAQMGYKTMYGEDTPGMATFNLEKWGFKRQPTDFYLRPFFLAAHEVINRSHIDPRLCMGAKPMHQVTLDWGTQFMKLMRDVPYFGLVWSNSLTHKNGDMIQLADNDLLKTFVHLHTNGYLRRTAVFVMSDHGRRWGRIRATRIGSYENRLPALFVYLPEEFREDKRSLYDNLKMNSRRLTSPYDVYRTFLHILRLSKNVSAGDDEGLSSHGMSLLEMVPEDRTCEDAEILSEWCACDETVDLDVHEPLVTSIATFVVQSINNAMKDVMDKCALLTLKEIVKAGQQRNVDLFRSKKDSKQYYYRVTVRVEPSNAMFEATVKTRNNPEGLKTIDGDITRLNLYGKQSHCVHDVTLKAFCYCLNQTP